MITPNAPHFSTPEGGEQPLSDLFMVRSPTRPTTGQAEGELTERQKFEAFFADSRRNRGAKKRPNFDTLADGTYADEHTQRHWWTWQSARRAGQGSPAVDREELLGDAIRALIAGSIKCSDDLPSDRRPVHVSARRAFGAVHGMLRLEARPATQQACEAAGGEEMLRLAQVALRESAGASIAGDWMAAALEVCRLVVKSAPRVATADATATSDTKGAM